MLLTIVMVLCVVGVLLWAVHSLIPMDGRVRKILDAVVIGALLIWIMRVLGLWTYLTKVHV